MPKEMLQIVGKVMEAGAWLVKGITYDGHFSHGYLKECLYGVFEKLSRSSLAEVPFWSKVTYADLPQHCLPHLPLKLCMHEGEAIWGLAGPCDLAVHTVDMCGH